MFLTILLSIIALIIAVVTIVVGSMALIHGRSSELRLHFFLLTLAGGFWIFTNVAFAWTSGFSQYLIALASYASALLTVVGLYAFCLSMINLKLSDKQRSLVYAGVLAAIISAIPGLVAYGVSGGAVLTQSLPLLIYGAMIIAFFVAACNVLIKGRRNKSKVKQIQSSSLLIGLLLTATVGLVCNLVLPAFNIYEFVLLGPTGVGLFVYAVSYSIVNYQLFDLRLAVVRSITYVTSITTLGLMYFLMIFAISELFFQRDFELRNMILYFGFSVFTILLFQPVKRFFDKITNAFFYRDNYDEEEFIARFTRGLVAGRDLRELLERAAKEIAGTLKADQVFFVVYESKGFATIGTRGHSKLPPVDIIRIDQLTKNDSKTIEADALESDSELLRLLRSHRIELLQPLRRGKQTVGFLMLGEHLGRGFRSRDFQILETLADELVIAVQNAVSVQEVREINATLQQRINDATEDLRRSNAELQRLDETKDEFISMASHQLRTPLTSIKGYISMVVEGDVGKITPDQTKLLKEAFTSSNRMVHLINDFLNVSRLETGKFVLDRTLTDLSALVGEEVESLRPTAKARSLQLEYEADSALPKLYLDEAKIRQVIMNFIDNAIYYSKNQTTIKISLKLDDGNLILKVKDTGIGVPASEQPRLFKKFYRASNARKHRPDGTGVGLFLSKRVINEHGGRIIFKSKENSGSTFGFSLPVRRLSLVPRDQTD